MAEWKKRKTGQSPNFSEESDWPAPIKEAEATMTNFEHVEFELGSGSSISFRKDQDFRVMLNGRAASYRDAKEGDKFSEVDEGQKNIRSGIIRRIRDEIV